MRPSRGLLGAALFVFAGCGSSPALSESDIANAPACSSVWVDGATLPENYVGCNDGGRFVESDPIDCGDDNEPPVVVLKSGEGNFAAVLGDKVTRIAAPDDEGSVTAYSFGC